jgi:hypothetical protein
VDAATDHASVRPRPPVSLSRVGHAIENEGPHEPRLDDQSPALALEPLRGALARYEASGSAAAFDRAFIEAARAVAAVRGDQAREGADAVEVRALMAELPEFERLVSIAVGEAERGAHAGASRLWEWFGLSSSPPRWDDGERSGARVIVASACAPLEGRGATWMRARLLRLAADRWATQLTSELRAGGEDSWRRALGERYESVRVRYAPRTKRRSGTLSQLLERDQRPMIALQKRLSRWLAEGGQFEALPDEVEAAFVQTRTPERLA